MITEIKDGAVKKRMILDTQASSVKEATQRGQRVLLPRLLDVVYQILFLMNLAVSASMGLELMVLDFSEAFWQIPLHPDERKFFGAKLTIEGTLRYLLYFGTVQGSRGAPLSWARTAALLMRLTFSPFDDSALRLLCFVDAPLVVLAGQPAKGCS